MKTAAIFLALFGSAAAFAPVSQSKVSRTVATPMNGAIYSKRRLVAISLYSQSCYRPLTVQHFFECQPR